MTNKKLEEKIVRANYELPVDVASLLSKAAKNETSVRGREFLKLIEENIAVALKKSYPLCQDTGTVSFHVNAGDKVKHLREAVRKAYGCLRNSQVKSPFEREEDPRNLPSINLAPDNFPPSFIIRGGGAMNCSGLIMANPSSDSIAIASEIADFVISKAPYCCPPVFVGVGIGGAPGDALLAGERALIKDVRRPMSLMEKKIFNKINKSGIGPGGWGGKNTVLCVRIDELPMHMATMSVGISMSCWCLRKGKI
ncbi:fumarate hydratase [bacterium]|nr:fumarate hydratase [bacterium]MBU3956171.1 fumarate hydratase [bacterium]MBU4134595.1 fumarate hydratase [bacterium]